MRISQILGDFLLCLCLMAGTCVGSVQLASIKNFRKVIPASKTLKLYRSSCLDEISLEDAKKLQSFISSNGKIIDLRNLDERATVNMTIKAEGYKFLQQNLLADTNLRHHPLIFSDRFWPRLEKELSFGDKIEGCMRGMVQKRGWERQLAMKLEERGLGLLYQIILETAATEIVEVLDIIVSSIEKGSPVVFHCAKGKDRTGIIASLLQQLEGGYTTAGIISEYTLSETLLGEELGSGESGNGIIDWRKLRGSPPMAMQEMLTHLEETGGLDVYLSRGGMVPERVNACREILRQDKSN